MKEKVILAYSGGLDTTAIIPWLKENFDYEVVCVCVDCGQGNELDGLEERAKYSGAEKLYIEDLTDDFCDNYYGEDLFIKAIKGTMYFLSIVCYVISFVSLAKNRQKEFILKQYKEKSFLYLNISF